MESILFGLMPLVVGVALLLFAFRAHERYWALGFMGWRKVYAGLVLFLFSGILTAIWPWTIGPGQDAVGRLVLWQMTSALAAAAGIGLLLAGAIERLWKTSAPDSISLTACARSPPNRTLFSKSSTSL
jgi:hypothetical protein